MVRSRPCTVELWDTAAMRGSLKHVLQASVAILYAELQVLIPSHLIVDAASQPKAPDIQRQSSQSLQKSPLCQCSPIPIPINPVDIEQALASSREKRSHRFPLSSLPLGLALILPLNLSPSLPTLPPKSQHYRALAAVRNLSREIDASYRNKVKLLRQNNLSERRKPID